MPSPQEIAKELVYPSDLMLDLDDLPEFAMYDFTAHNDREKVYAEYAIWCSRQGLDLCEPQQLRKEHFGKGSVLNFQCLDCDQLEIVEHFIQKLDQLEGA